jgi:D-alanyl-D-alanine-carboxypeptidase/D-alanyl-D-alanine-endopeptidase
MTIKIIYLLSFLTLIFFGCEEEQDVQTLDQKIERVAKKYIIHGRAPGIIVGTIKNGETKIYSYGVANLETGVPIDELTIFEIGSITKTFTGLLCAQFVLEGKFALQDTVNNYLNQSLQLPSKNSVPIRWIHLLNHTSGLERQPEDLDKNQPFDYSENQMSAYLSRTNLMTDPGEKLLYSNTGMGLAGYALTEIAESTYASMLERRIFTKLNMTHSFTNNNDTPATNTAQGYNGNKQNDYFIMTDVFAGAGAIKSNMHDMLIYLSNCLYPETSVLKDAINLSLTPTFQIEERQNIGLGWFVGMNDDNQRTAAHNGGTYGFASFIGFNLDKKTGVVVLINSYCFGEQDLIGTEIMKLLDDEN